MTRFDKLYCLGDLPADIVELSPNSFAWKLNAENEITGHATCIEDAMHSIYVEYEKFSKRVIEKGGVVRPPLVDYHPQSNPELSISDPRWLALSKLSINNTVYLSLKHFKIYSNDVAEFWLGWIQVRITASGLNRFSGEVTMVELPLDNYLIGSTISFITSNIIWMQHPPGQPVQVGS